MTLHDFFTLKILPRINIRVQYIKYTSEYIPKLQIHQHPSVKEAHNFKECLTSFGKALGVETNNKKF